MVDSIKNATAIRSPFMGHTVGVHPDKANTVGVQINAGTLHTVTQISTWSSGISGFLGVMQSVFSTVPSQTGMAADTAWGLLMRTGPEEFLLVGNRSENMTARLRMTIAADVGSVTDLSHARCYIHIEGPQCRNTLGKLFALDLRESAFPIGEIRLTGTHHVPCTLHRLGADTFNLFVYSTYAYDQLATVLDAALEYGVNLKSIA